KGVYRFSNPRPVPEKMRFTVPTPQGGGTMQGFTLRVGPAKVVDPDQTGQYSWNGIVPAGGKVVAQVSYRLTGAGGYHYALGSERRRTGMFHLTATSDRPPQFGRAGIFPTSLSQDRAEWTLRDVITSQSVSLVFPRVD